MKEDTHKTLSVPAVCRHDFLTEVLRNGAQRLLADAVEAEVAEWIESHSRFADEHGRRQVVRNGHMPSRSILMSVGPVEVARPRENLRGQGKSKGSG